MTLHVWAILEIAMQERLAVNDVNFGYCILLEMLVLPSILSLVLAIFL